MVERGQPGTYYGCGPQPWQPFLRWRAAAPFGMVPRRSACVQGQLHVHFPRKAVHDVELGTCCAARVVYAGVACRRPQQQCNRAEFAYAQLVQVLCNCQHNLSMFQSAGSWQRPNSWHSMQGRSLLAIGACCEGAGCLRLLLINSFVIHES